MNLPGALDPASFSGVSLGSGTGPGAGSGDGTGIGPGDGPGLGMGRDGNFGGQRGAGANILPPIVVRSVKPHNTTEAMRARIQGAVLVAAIVETDGSVRDARVVRLLDGVFGLDQAAVRAANQRRSVRPRWTARQSRWRSPSNLSSRCGRSGVSARIR